MKKVLRKLIGLSFAAMMYAALFSIVSNAAGTNTIEVSVSGKINYTKAFTLLERVNQLRTQEKLDPIMMDVNLLEAAMKRAAELTLKYSPTRPDNTSGLTIYDGVAAENIAAGYNQFIVTKDIFTNWKANAQYNANFLNPDFKSAGVGYFRQDTYTYCVMIF